MITDLHCHTKFSIDGYNTPQEMIKAAEEKGIDILAFTDHADFAEGDSCVDPANYLAEMKKAGSVSNKVKVLYGIEVGLQFEHRKKFAEFMRNQEFDFVIGSMHRAQEKDFFNGEFYKNLTAKECWQIYLRETLKAVKSCNNFDVLGHLDIITRYDHMTGAEFPEELMPELDLIFAWLIENGKGLEVNTSKFHLFNRCHPQQSILRRYKELGGEIVTLGSDGHTTDGLGKNLMEGLKALKVNGFNKIAWYEARKIRFAEI